MNETSFDVKKHLFHFTVLVFASLSAFLEKNNIFAAF